MRAGDKIRVSETMMGFVTGHKDFTVEEFRYCLGIFESDDHRLASKFTPLCELFEPAPDSERKYISNFGEYNTKYVQYWMDLPR